MASFKRLLREAVLREGDLLAVLGEREALGPHDVAHRVDERVLVLGVAVGIIIEQGRNRAVEFVLVLLGDVGLERLERGALDLEREEEGQGECGCVHVCVFTLFVRVDFFIIGGESFLVVFGMSGV